MVEFIPFAGQDTLSFRQLDTLNKVPRGTSFRIFKRHRDRLVEGIDYFYLDATTHGPFIEQLRSRGLIHAATPNAVLITRQGYEKMRANDDRGGNVSGRR